MTHSTGRTIGETLRLNKLSTPESRTAYIARVTTLMEDGARALLENAAAIRADPDSILRLIYKSHIDDPIPRPTGYLELNRIVTVHDPEVQEFKIKGRTLIEGSQFNEIEFNTTWSGKLPPKDT